MLYRQQVIALWLRSII